MLKFLFKRICFQLIPVMVIIIVMTFAMIQTVPGGPFDSERKVPPQVEKKLKEHYGLDQPFHVQLGRYLWNVCPKKLNPAALIHFDLKEGLGIDLGPSTRYEGRTINELIADAFPVSFELGFYAIVIALLLGIPAGSLAALKQNTFWDYVPMSLAMMGICLPTFVLGPMLQMFLSLDVFNLGLNNLNLPVSGWSAPGAFSWTDSIPYKILPSITLGLYYAAGLARLTRGGMLEVLHQDYIRTARAKGLSEWKITAKHALRAGLIPVISYLGPVIAGLLSGSFIIETIFQIPGMGRHFINAIINRDQTLVLGTVMFYGSLIVLANMIVDMLLVLLNPKLKFD